MSGPAPPSDPQPALPVLEYGDPALAPAPRLGLLRRFAVLVASVAAVASIFLPFTFNTSPWAVVEEGLARGPIWDEDLLLIAFPFFAGLPIAIWSVRRLIRPALRRIERAAMYLIALACAAPTAFIGGRILLFEGSASLLEILQIALGPTMLAAGVALVVLLLRRGDRDGAAVTALHTGYAANGMMLLVVLFSPDHPGWWATLVAVSGMVAEAVLAGVQPRRR